MRLLTHNVLNNNSPNAKGNGYPLRLIQVTSVRIDPTSAASSSSSSDDSESGDDHSKVEFIKGIVPTLHWPALVQATRAVGITTLPEILQEDMIQDKSFQLALYHILLHVHVVEGILVCPATQQQFVITNEIPNFIY